MTAPELRRARVAVLSYFFVLGVATATWSARLPAIKEALHLSDGGLACPLALVPIGAAGDLGWLMTALACYGAMAGLLDVSMNACGAKLELAYGRPILSSLHAGYSIAGLAGAGIGGLSAALDVAPLPTFAGQSYPGYSNIGGWNLYINPHSKNINADLTFIKWMAGTTAQGILATKYSEIPTTTAVRNSPSVIALNPVLAIVGKTKLVPRPAGTPNYPQLSSAIYQNVNAALSGSSSPSSAMGAAQSAANTALSSSAGGL